ncbi:right-handed parallel beta-helix repeat-containing protein, partial [Nocardioides gilvus]|uniref:right-handed parallel beta-helix repeat-containing protein n=1 Tax=Nocardioides gilvus TaxID=1735589 RepID=UPI00195135AA
MLTIALGGTFTPSAAEATTIVSETHVEPYSNTAEAYVERLRTLTGGAYADDDLRLMLASDITGPVVQLLVDKVTAVEGRAKDDSDQVAEAYKRMASYIPDLAQDETLATLVELESMALASKWSPARVIPVVYAASEAASQVAQLVDLAAPLFVMRDYKIVRNTYDYQRSLGFDHTAAGIATRQDEVIMAGGFLTRAASGFQMGESEVLELAALDYEAATGETRSELTRLVARLAEALEGSKNVRAVVEPSGRTHLFGLELYESVSGDDGIPFSAFRPGDHLVLDDPGHINAVSGLVAGMLVRVRVMYVDHLGGRIATRRQGQTLFFEVEEPWSTYGTNGPGSWSSGGSGRTATRSYPCGGDFAESYSGTLGNGQPFTLEARGHVPAPWDLEFAVSGHDIGNPVNVTAGPGIPRDGSVSVAWDFQDGRPPTSGFTATRTFDNAGLRHITMIVSTDSCSTSVSEDVAIVDAEGVVDLTSVSRDTRLTSAVARYRVPYPVTIPKGVVLSAEPGVTLEFATDARLDVLGTFKTQGTGNAPVVLTRTKSSSESWSGLEVSRGGHLLLTGAEIRHARTAISTTNDSSETIIDLDRSTITHSGTGVSVHNGIATITDTTFADAGPSAIAVFGGHDHTMVGNTITDSSIGINAGARDANVRIEGTTFNRVETEISTYYNGSSVRVSDTRVLDGTGRIEVGGPHTSNIAWTGDLTYVVTARVDLPAGSTLDIAPGRVVKFAPSTGRLPNQFHVDGGTLNISGTPAAPVTLTALADDTVGGDTNHDGHATIPTRGTADGGIYLARGGRVHLFDTHLRHATTALSTANDSSETIIDLDRSTITHSGTGVSVHNGIATITDTTFADAGPSAIAVFGGHDHTMVGNTITDSSIGINAGARDANVRIEGTTFNRVETEISTYYNGSSVRVSDTRVLDGTGRIEVGGPHTSNIAWTGDLTYVVTARVDLPAGSTLDIAPGRVVKFAPSTGRLPNQFHVDGGTLNISGTPAAPVTLTALADDTVGGDTNHDGHATIPTRGTADGGIYLARGGRVHLFDTHLRHATTALSTANDSSETIIDLDRSTITHSGTGITAHTGTTTVDDSSFNDVDLGINAESPTTVRRTDLSRTRTGAAGGAMLDARLNWWGSREGPGIGEGRSSATELVRVAPWCTTPSCTEESSVPAAPAKPTVVLDGRTATVSWPAPATNGAALTGYTITGTNGAGVKTVAGDATSVEFPDLDRGKAYSFTLIATNAVGNSAPSPASDAITIAALKPDTPTKPTVTLGGRTATVSWPAPATNGAALTGYTITGTNGAGVKTVAGDATSVEFPDLDRGKAYSFTLIATNAVGNSAPSPASDAIT